MIIKRWNGSAFLEQYPKTIAPRVFNTAGNEAIFDGNDKIKPKYLPDSVFDSLYFFGSVNANATGEGGDKIISNVIYEGIRSVSPTLLSPFGNTSPSSPSRTVLGFYWVATDNIYMEPSSNGVWYPSATRRAAAAAEFPSAKFFGTDLPYYVTSNPSGAISGVSKVQNRTTGIGFIWNGTSWTSVGDQGNLPPATFTQNATYFDTRTRKLLVWTLASTTVGQLSNTSPGTGDVWITTQVTGQEAGSVAEVNGGLNTSTTVPSNLGQLLEAGDWFVITNITGDGSSATPYMFSVSVVDNKYDVASTEAHGIIKISDKTNVGVYNASTNTGGLRANDYSFAITEGALLNMMGTGANKIAYADHAHGNITTGGLISSTVVAPADTDTILISDTSNSGKIERSITLGTTTTTFLSNAGTWLTPAGTYSHPTQSAINANATDNGINVIDSVTVNTLGHVTAVGTRDLSAATTSAAGVMSAADKTKLDGIATNANNYVHPNHTGDVTSTGDGATAIANNVVTNAKLATVATATIKGRASASTGNVEDLTAAQVRTILNVADGANNYTHPSFSLTQAAGTETTLTDITLIDSLTTNSTGHLTNATWRKLVAGSNVTITPAANGNITIASSFTDTTYTAKALGGLALDGTAFQMNHPLFVQTTEPSTPLSGTIWLDIN